jgi:ethanolamine ammonia-lyase small subunit
LLVGRSGAAYRTSTQLELREAHAAARDAVRHELDLEKQFGADLVKRFGLFEVCTRAASKDEYLLRPDLGRMFSDESRADLAKRCSPGADLQIAIGDGLSVTALAAQVPALLPLLHDGAKARGWKLGQTFVVRHCRVGILNQIGELLAPAVAVLLIGERPGLATAESLSAYMAYRSQKSNIHARGVSHKAAVARILDLASQMMKMKLSGTHLREDLPALEK